MYFLYLLDFPKTPITHLAIDEEEFQVLKIVSLLILYNPSGCPHALWLIGHK